MVLDSFCEFTVIIIYICWVFDGILYGNIIRLEVDLCLILDINFTEFLVVIIFCDKKFMFIRGILRRWLVQVWVWIDILLLDNVVILNGLVLVLTLLVHDAPDVFMHSFELLLHIFIDSYIFVLANVLLLQVMRLV